MLSCKEVAHAVAKEELPSAGWRQRFSIRLHLLMCSHCRRYVQQMRQIGTATRELLRVTGPETENHKHLRKSILDQIPRHQKDDSETRV